MPTTSLHKNDSSAGRSPSSPDGALRRGNIREYLTVTHRCESQCTPPLHQQIGRYKVIEQISHGGQGAVYRTLDPLLQRELAVKVGHRQVAEESAEFSRIILEGSHLANLHHPSLPEVYDSGIVDGVPYLAMELIDGVQLDAYRREHRLNRNQIMRWMLDLSSAVQASHQAGILHLDLKPSNVLITQRGDCKLIDFGLGWAFVSQRRCPVPLTAGTPGYLSPEQERGETNCWNESTDVFGLGAILYFLLTGRTPGEDVPTDHPPPTFSPPRQNRDLMAIAQLALSPNQADRYCDVQTFRRALTQRQRATDAVLAIIFILSGISLLIFGLMSIQTSSTESEWDQVESTGVLDGLPPVQIQVQVRTDGSTSPQLLIWTQSRGLFELRGLKDHLTEGEQNKVWVPRTPDRSLAADFPDRVCAFIVLPERLLTAEQIASWSTTTIGGPCRIVPAGTSSLHPGEIPAEVPKSLHEPLERLHAYLSGLQLPYQWQILTRSEQTLETWMVHSAFDLSGKTERPLSEFDQQ